MKTRRLLQNLAGALLVLSTAAFAQFGGVSPKQHRILGYWDDATGTFKPLQPSEAEADAEAPAVTPRTGTLTFTITILAKSAVPKNGIVTCTGSAEVSDGSAGFSSAEAVTGIAKLSTGTTYTCPLTIHYSWALSTPATDMVSLAVEANIEEGFQVTATNATTTFVQPAAIRSSSQDVGTIKVPANGATTTETISITL